MENSGKPWTTQEENQLKKFYIEDNMSIMEIAKIHKRFPGGLTSRLKKLGIIFDCRDVRGYEDYRNSELYKQACEKSRERYKKIEEDNKDIIKNKAILENSEIKNSIYELKNEVKEMKLEIKELRLMMKEFISSVEVS